MTGVALFVVGRERANGFKFDTLFAHISQVKKVNICKGFDKSFVWMSFNETNVASDSGTQSSRRKCMIIRIETRFSTLKFAFAIDIKGTVPCQSF